MKTPVLVFVALFLTSFTKVHSQTLITSCDAEFIDLGGQSGNYSNSENASWLICPDDISQLLEITFTQVEIEVSNTPGPANTGCKDLLYIYDGINSAAPLIGSFCGEESIGAESSVNGHTLYIGDKFTPTNDDGCFYIRFVSDNLITKGGWMADVTCCTPSLSSGITDGHDLPLATNEGTPFNLEIDNTCLRQGNLSLISEFLPSGNFCFTAGMTQPNQSFYAFTTDHDGGFIEFDLDPIDNVGTMEMIVYGPVNLSGNIYTGGAINDCVSGVDPWNLFFNGGPEQTYILGVATEIPGRTTVTTTEETVGLSIILPVVLKNYSLQTAKSDVILEWSTTHEINNDYFEIYRSWDGYNFEAIGRVNGKENVQSHNEYVFADKQQKVTNDAYYYVRQVDLDGKFEDFDVLHASFKGGVSNFTSFPNPSRDGQIGIDTKDFNSEYTLQVINPLGVSIHTQTMGKKDPYIDIELPNGVYRFIATTESEVHIITHIVSR